MGPTSIIISMLPLLAAADPPLRSGPITWLGDGKTLALSYADARAVVLVETRPLRGLALITVPGSPRAVSTGSGGRTLYASLPERDLVISIDLLERRVSGEIAVRGGPFALLAHPSDERLYVASFYTHHLHEIDGRTGTTLRRLRTGRAPRGLSLSPRGERLYCVHFFTGALGIIDTSEWKMLDVIGNRPDANLARCASLAPDGLSAFLPHIRSNTTESRLRFDSTIFPVVSCFDLSGRRDARERRISLDAIGRPVNNPWDAAVSPDGRRLYVVNSGSDDLSVIDVESGLSLAQIDVGRGPRGVALSPDGSRAYVQCELSGELSEIDTDLLLERRRIRLARSRLSPRIQRGKVLFHTTRLASMTYERWISCASCHPDGESDGRVWRFASGPRKTPSLRGCGRTLPHNRSPDRDEIQDAEHFIRDVMGGEGLIPGRDPPPKRGPPSAGRSEDADALAAYVLSLEHRVSPFASGDDEWMESLRRGREIFLHPRTKCRRCHPPPEYTDSRLDASPWRIHDVGTADGGGEQRGAALDTPSLLGLYAATRYLHDGRARSLREVFTVYNPEDRHGVTSHLSPGEIDDLVAFLLSLPGPGDKELIHDEE